VDPAVARQFLRGEIDYIPRHPYTRGKAGWTAHEVMLETAAARDRGRASNSSNSRT